MSTIYVCSYATGERSDYSTTPMCAFVSEEEAKNFVNQCNALLKEKGMHMDNFTAPDRYGSTIELGGKTYRVDYTGAEVDYHSLELR